MNLIIHNIGHYRVTDNGRKGYQLFNRNDGGVYNITEKQYRSIREHMSIDACKFVEGVRQQVVS